MNNNIFEKILSVDALSESHIEDAENYSEKWHQIFITMKGGIWPSYIKNLPRLPKELSPQTVSLLLPVYKDCYNDPKSRAWRVYLVIKTGSLFAYRKTKEAYIIVQKKYNDYQIKKLEREEKGEEKGEEKEPPVSPEKYWIVALLGWGCIFVAAIFSSYFSGYEFKAFFIGSSLGIQAVASTNGISYFRVVALMIKYFFMAIFCLVVISFWINKMDLFEEKKVYKNINEESYPYRKQKPRGFSF